MQTNFSSCQKADLGIQQDPGPVSLQHRATYDFLSKPKSVVY